MFTIVPRGHCGAPSCPRTLDMLRVTHFVTSLSLAIACSFYSFLSETADPCGPLGRFLSIFLTLSRPGQHNEVPSPLFHSCLSWPFANVLKFSRLKGHHPNMVQRTEGKHILSEHCVLWQEGGMADRDKLCTSDFTKAWLGSKGRVCPLPTCLSGLFTWMPAHLCLPGVTDLPTTGHHC